MTKSISPLLFRSNIFSNYINTVNIKLNKNINYITYFKFFQILLNIISLYKKKINNFKINKTFLYFKCSYIDFYNIIININFLKIENKKYLIYNYNKLFFLTNYINYFIKYNISNSTPFIWLFITNKKYVHSNKFYIMKYIKMCLAKYSNYYIKIIKFCNKIIKTKYKKYINPLKSIKLIYAGCISKGGDKKRIFKYTKGSIPITSIEYNVNYIFDYIKTYNGVIGVKCWLLY